METYLPYIVAAILCICVLVATVEFVITLRRVRGDLQTFVHTTCQTMDQVEPVIQKIDATLDDLQPSVKELSSLLEDTHVTVAQLQGQLNTTEVILEHVREVSDSAAGAANTVAGVAQGAISGITSTASTFAQHFMSGYKASRHMFDRVGDDDAPGETRVQIPGEDPAQAALRDVAHDVDDAHATGVAADVAGSTAETPNTSAHTQTRPTYAARTYITYPEPAATNKDGDTKHEQ